jgi:hypothetical protein
MFQLRSTRALIGEVVRAIGGANTRVLDEGGAPVTAPPSGLRLWSPLMFAGASQA